MQAPAPVGFWEAFRFWLKLGFISFGGPAGQIAIMHSELVERRRWISEGRFLHALNYCMVLPGPEAQQLATYLGWLMHRTWGGIVAGVLFVLPSLFILIGLSWLYLAQGQQPLVMGLFAGLKPAVAALVLQAAHRLGSRALKHRALWAVAGLAFVALHVLGWPFPVVVGGAGVLGLLGARWWPQVFERTGDEATASGAHAPALIDDDSPTPAHARFSRGRLAAVLLGGLGLWALSWVGLRWMEGGPGVLSQMAGFFSRAALLTFGGAYAVLPYVHQAAVEHYGWLTAAQMMDGLALGESTPGPLIMIVAFVGFVGGWPGGLGLAVLSACVATWFTFLPSFVFILAGGPLVESTHGQLRFTAPLTAISAAVVGVILSLGLFFTTRVVWPQGGGWDVGASLLLAAALFGLFRLRMGVLPLLAVAGAAGVARSWLGA